MARSGILYHNGSLTLTISKNECFQRIKIELANKIESWKVQYNATFLNYYKALAYTENKIGVNKKLKSCV